MGIRDGIGTFILEILEKKMSARIRTFFQKFKVFLNLQANVLKSLTKRYFKTVNLIG